MVRLACIAHETDPVHSLPIPLLCKRVYGVEAVGSVWRLFLMVSEGDEYVGIVIPLRRLTPNRPPLKSGAAQRVYRQAWHSSLVS